MERVSGTSGMEKRADETFDAYYERVLAPSVPGVLALRRRCRLRAAAVAVLAFAVVFLVLIAFPELSAAGASGGRNWFAVLLFSAAAGIVAFYVAEPRFNRSAVLDFRNAILRPIAAFVDPGLAFDAKRDIPGATFADSLLFDRVDDGYTRLTGAGLFGGEIDGLTVSFSALRAQKAVRHGCSISRGLLFGGLFIVMKRRTPVDGFVVAAPRLAGLTGEVLSERLEKTDLGPPAPLPPTGVPDFDRAFALYGSARSGAASRFTHKDAWVLLDFRNQDEALPFFSRIGDTAYLALMTGGNHFQMPQAGRPLDAQTCREYRADLVRCLDFIRRAGVILRRAGEEEKSGARTL